MEFAAAAASGGNALKLPAGHVLVRTIHYVVGNILGSIVVITVFRVAGQR
jgi:hypothetical protein